MSDQQQPDETFERRRFVCKGVRLLDGAGTRQRLRLAHSLGGDRCCPSPLVSSLIRSRRLLHAV